MRTISEQQLANLVEVIVHDREKQAIASGRQFLGMTRNEVCDEIDRRIGSADWKVMRVNLQRWTKEDFDAVATNRFYRQTGLKLLMLFGIAILGLATLTATFHIIPTFIYYGLVVVGVVGFVFLFAKKQREARKEFRRIMGLEGLGIEGTGEK